jgi:branched-chain amino acid transport system permease protein
MDAGTIANGLLLGGFYALVGLGLSLVFGVLRLVNLAHGDLVVGGAYLAAFLAGTLHIAPLAATPAVMVVAGAAGYLIQRCLLTGMLIRGTGPALVATFGLSLIAQAAFTELFTADARSLPSALATSGVSWLGITLRSAYLISFLVAAVCCAVVQLALARTRVGAVVRAAAADPETAGLMGYDIRAVYALTFAAAAALAALSGVLVGVTFSVAPSAGGPYLLIAMTVVVLGGVGSVAGTFVGGTLLGLAQTLTAALAGGGYRDLAVYLLFFTVLAIRPTGLFGRSPA